MLGTFPSNVYILAEEKLRGSLDVSGESVVLTQRTCPRTITSLSILPSNMEVAKAWLFSPNADPVFCVSYVGLAAYSLLQVKRQLWPWDTCSVPHSSWVRAGKIAKPLAHRQHIHSSSS